MGKKYTEMFFHGSGKTNEDLQDFFAENLKKGDIYEVFDRISDFSEEYIQSENIQTIARARFIELLKEGKPTYLGILEKFSLPDEFIDSEEVQSIARSLYIYYSELGLTYEKKQFKDDLRLPNEFTESSEVQLANLEGLIYKLKNEDPMTAIYIKDNLPLPEGFMNLPEVKEAVSEAVSAVNKLKEPSSIIEKLKTAFYPLE